MKEYVSLNTFMDRFNAIRPDNFSYEGLKALYEYLEQYEEDVGEEIEFDVIALCCDYTEYEDLKEFQSEYGNKYESIDDIMEHTAVIMIDDESFIIGVF